MEIPKYYPGQPGFKKANAQERQNEIESKKLVVDWKENPLTGQISSARIKNIPGFESKNKPLFHSKSKSIAPIASPKYSVEYLNLLKSAVNEDGARTVKKPEKPSKAFEITDETMGRWRKDTDQGKDGQGGAAETPSGVKLKRPDHSSMSQTVKLKKHLVTIERETLDFESRKFSAQV